MFRGISKFYQQRKFELILYFLISILSALFIAYYVMQDIVKTREVIKSGHRGPVVVHPIGNSDQNHGVINKVPIALKSYFVNLVDDIQHVSKGDPESNKTFSDLDTSFFHTFCNVSEKVTQIRECIYNQFAVSKLFDQSVANSKYLATNYLQVANKIQSSLLHIAKFEGEKLFQLDDITSQWFGSDNVAYALQKFVLELKKYQQALEKDKELVTYTDNDNKAQLLALASEYFGNEQTQELEETLGITISSNYILGALKFFNQDNLITKEELSNFYNKEISDEVIQTNIANYKFYIYNFLSLLKVIVNQDQLSVVIADYEDLESYYKSLFSLVSQMAQGYIYSGLTPRNYSKDVLDKLVTTRVNENFSLYIDLVKINFEQIQRLFLVTTVAPDLSLTRDEATEEEIRQYEQERGTIKEPTEP